MNLNATLINLYHVCPRECWLHANGINMEHTSDTVYDGKLLHETSYPQRADKYTEIELSANWNGATLSGKIDFYDQKEKTIHETKRGKSVEEAHTWQVKFYIWLLELNGVEGAMGKIEYPRLRKTTEVFLTGPDRAFLEETVPNIRELVQREKCPPTINARICKKCSYYELCYIDEA
ncbi:CRISPR-associated protein Cas4 [Gramella sp. AN32]|uniref:CRISPR-associated exonuclease Cas4 n=1 Tax=Christiangramia antarctica TaxID=2058158 RepID=A0ABW5X6Z0_9FLAO|nr:CRISPR-associated protein Cas4 [Gramella sp. AN32]MCM4154765.1 CRISPR-associated protein Cas4 [Gramella sp. AN32]